jgi:amidase
VKLGLGQLLYPVVGLERDPLDFGGDLLETETALAQIGGNRLEAGDFLADEEQQAFAQQVYLTGEVVGQRAERNTGGGGYAPVGDGGNTLAADQLDRCAEDALAGIGGCGGSQEASAYPHRLSFVRTNNSLQEEEAMAASTTGTTAEAVAQRTDEHDFTGLEEQVLLLQAGKASSRELVEAALERAEAAQTKLNAFRLIRAEEALAEADEADRRLGAGDGAALLGVPVAIKDDLDLAGHTTPFGCGGGRPAVRDAEAARRLREAGAIIIGKTHAPEVGLWHFTETPLHGATRNPWHTDHTPGGSSGGAAAAVAAGVVPAAIGSDGAGSIRIPAAWTGLVGLKPQRGRVSTWPDAESFNGLSCYGPLARSAGDAALLLDAVHGNVPADLHKPKPPAEQFSAAAAREPGRLRVAISFATPFGVPNSVDREHRAAIEGFAERLGDLGHEIVRIDPDYGMVGPTLVARGEAAVEEWLCAHGEDRATLEPRTRAAARMGKALQGLPLRISRAAEPSLQRRIGRVFERCDLVLTPTTAKPPPRIGALDGRGYWKTGNTASAICPFAFAWNVVGWPGLSVPAGLTASGLPIGAQLLGRESDEATLLSLAGQVERAQGGWPQPS